MTNPKNPLEINLIRSDFEANLEGRQFLVNPESLTIKYEIRLKEPGQDAIVIHHETPYSLYLILKHYINTGNVERADHLITTSLGMLKSRFEKSSPRKPDTSIRGRIDYSMLNPHPEETDYNNGITTAASYYVSLYKESGNYLYITKARNLLERIDKIGDWSSWENRRDNAPGSVAFFDAFMQRLDFSKALKIYNESRKLKNWNPAKLLNSGINRKIDGISCPITPVELFVGGVLIQECGSYRNMFRDRLSQPVLSFPFDDDPSLKRSGYLKIGDETIQVEYNRLLREESIEKLEKTPPTELDIFNQVFSKPANFSELVTFNNGYDHDLWFYQGKLSEASSDRKDFREYMFSSCNPVYTTEEDLRKIFDSAKRFIKNNSGEKSK